MELFFDTETSGFINKSLAADDPKQSWIMQLAFILGDSERIYTEFSALVKSGGRSCNPHAQKVHEISITSCDLGGMREQDIAKIFHDNLQNTQMLVAHNIFFDLAFLCQMLDRVDSSVIGDQMRNLPLFCTMKSSTDLCKLPGKFGKYKWPKLTELYKFLFDEEFEGAHDALADVRATRKCYYRLKEVL